MRIGVNAVMNKTWSLYGAAWGVRLYAHVIEDVVEIGLPDWSGRRDCNDAIEGIDTIIKFLSEVRKEIVNSTRTPGLHLSDIFEDDCKKSWRAEIVETEILNDQLKENN